MSAAAASPPSSPPTTVDSGADFRLGRAPTASLQVYKGAICAPFGRRVVELTNVVNAVFSIRTATTINTSIGKGYNYLMEHHTEINQVLLIAAVVSTLFLNGIGGTLFLLSATLLASASYEHIKLRLDNWRPSEESKVATRVKSFCVEFLQSHTDRDKLLTRIAFSAMRLLFPSTFIVWWVTEGLFAGRSIHDKGTNHMGDV